MPHLRQSTVGTWKAGPFMDQTSGTGTVTNLTITPDLVRLSKNGANYAAKNHAGTAVHDESGWYDIVIDATDTDTLGRLDAFVHTGALPVWKDWEVIEASKYDWLYGTNSIPSPTGGTVDLAVQVNSGTVDRVVTGGTVDRANSVPFQNPTGGTVDLAVQVNTGTVLRAVTVGTADRVNSAPASNPTGGTVDLAVAINTNGDKTGYDLNADQTAVSFGTAQKVIAGGNPSGGTVDLAVAINTNGDKTGYDLNADQTAVSFGTVQKTIASANPTGGTIDLTVQVNTGTVLRAVSAGTIDRANSVPNPTGGTMDLTTNAGTLIQSLSRGEPGQGAPAASTDAFAKMDYLYKGWRNKKLHNGTVFQLFNDAGNTVDQKSTDSDGSGTAITGEMTTGA